MRKEYKKALGSLISKFKSEHFQSSDLKRMGCNSLIWLTKPTDSRQICIVFSESNKGEEFDVSLGWAKSRVLPTVNLSGVDAFDLEGPAFEKEEHLLSVKVIGGDHGTGWEITPPALSFEELAKGLEPVSDEKALEIVTPVFEESVKAIRECAIPFLERMNVDISWAMRGTGH